MTNKTALREALKNRYDFILIYEAKNCNPNGDPDMDNRPRTDVETNLGIVTDVCIKSKVRKYIDLVKHGEEGYELFIKPEGTLNYRENEALKEVSGKDITELKDKKCKLDRKDIVKKAKRYLSNRYVDIRLFGGTMTLSQQLKADGQMLGGVQIGFSESIDPVSPVLATITRAAVTTEKDKEEKGSHTMGNKYYIPYGLYRMEGHIDAAMAEAKYTDEEGYYGVSEEDVSLLWEALLNMFEHDNAANRTGMHVKRLIIFKHDSKYGNVHSDKLFDRVVIEKKEGVVCPRSFRDYNVVIDDAGLNEHVKIQVLDGNEE